MSLLDKGPETPVVPVVHEYRSTILAQLNGVTSPIRASPNLTAMQSGSGSKCKRPRSQTDVRLKTPKKNANVAVATTSKSTVRSRTRVTSRGVSGKRTCSARGRRTGGKPQSSKMLVLSVAASGSVDQGDQSSDDISARPNRKGRRTTRVESSDEH